MQFRNFIKEKIPTIFLLFLGILSIEIFLMIYPIGNFIKIYIPIAILGLYFLGLLFEYFPKRNFYKHLSDILEELDEKYLVTEIIKMPDFWEGKIFKSSLEQIDKSMLEHVNQYKYLQEDYKEYIELWIHEIKLPIAVSKMVIENNKNSVTRNIDEELDKIENYIEQALFYARSNAVEKDYYIKKSNLKEIVNESIKKNKNLLMQEKTKLNLHDLEIEVNTDSKWMVFILNQILQNSCKYRKEEDLEIEVQAQKGKEKVILWIKDNGIGIPKGEMTRVFEKGFTGTNGRMSNKKSTGIGLYLCKKMCDKLGIAIELNSVQKEGTQIRLVFPQGSYMKL